MASGSTYQCRCQFGYMGRNCEQADICGVRSPCLCGTCQNDPMSALGFKCMSKKIENIVYQILYCQIFRSLSSWC